MNSKTIVSIVVVLLIIAGGAIAYVIHVQREKASLEQHERAEQLRKREAVEAKAKQEYDEARKKTGQFLVPDTKSRMRFDEEGTASPSPSEAPR